MWLFHIKSYLQFNSGKWEIGMESDHVWFLKRHNYLRCQIQAQLVLFHQHRCTCASFSRILHLHWCISKTCLTWEDNLDKMFCLFYTTTNFSGIPRPSLRGYPLKKREKTEIIAYPESFLLKVLAKGLSEMARTWRGSSAVCDFSYFSSLLNQLSLRVSDATMTNKRTQMTWLWRASFAWTYYAQHAWRIGPSVEAIRWLNKTLALMDESCIE